MDTRSRGGRVVCVHDLLAQREQRKPGHLEAGDPKRDANDRKAKDDADDELRQGEPQAGDEEPDHVADRRPSAGVGTPHDGPTERPQGVAGQPEGRDPEGNRDDQDERQKSERGIGERQGQPSQQQPDHISDETKHHSSSIYLSHLSGDPSPTGPYPTGPSAASWSRHRQTSPLPTPGTPAVWDPRTPSGRIGSRPGFMTTAEPNAPQPPGPRPDPGTSVVVAWMVQVRGVEAPGLASGGRPRSSMSPRATRSSTASRMMTWPVGWPQKPSASPAATTAPMRSACLCPYTQVPTGPVRKPAASALPRSQPSPRTKPSRVRTAITEGPVRNAPAAITNARTSTERRPRRRSRTSVSYRSAAASCDTLGGSAFRYTDRKIASPSASTIIPAPTPREAPMSARRWFLAT